MLVGSRCLPAASSIVKKWGEMAENDRQIVELNQEKSDLEANQIVELDTQIITLSDPTVTLWKEDIELEKKSDQPNARTAEEIERQIDAKDRQRKELRKRRHEIDVISREKLQCRLANSNRNCNHAE